MKTILKKGISGFYNISEQPPELITASVFKNDISSVLSSVGFKPKSFIESGITPNFHYAHFTSAGCDLHIVCNEIYPVIAFVNMPDLKSCRLEFILNNEIKKIIEQYSIYKVLNPEELNNPIQPNDLKQLNSAELGQIEYWKPETVGEIVFNWWD